MRERAATARESSRRTKWCAAASVIASCILLHASAFGLSVNVVGSDGPAIGEFRWVLEEDTTYRTVPGQIDPATLSVRFHTSYMPVAASGDESDSANIPVDPAKRYYVSVLPDGGYSIGGAAVAAGQGSVTVTVNKLPLPTAQLSVFVYEDNHPINNAPDTPEEVGLPGFKVILFDAAGRYGQAGGQMMMDAFGNMLGTTYDGNGDMLSMGDGVFVTDDEGIVRINNLPPGKYGVQAVPPAGEDWHQTATIEGSKTIDAWVKAGEPSFFVEFGPPGYHVTIGFVKTTNDASVLNGENTISGQVVSLHTSRPPEYTFYGGQPFPGAWVGLNELAGGNGRGVYAAPCGPDSTFSIPNVPPGDYQLVIWDENLLLVFGLLGVTVTEGEDLDLEEVPVFPWFGRMENYVFLDTNENGFRDPGEPGIPEQAVNLRFRDGTIYQSFPTDLEGYVPFDEVFPFFHWLVAEVDFARLKATGATFIVDDGGPVLPDQGWAYPSRGVLTPQEQFEADGVTPLINPNTGNNLSRTEVGPVLTQAFQLFLGQTSVIEWGKAPYGEADEDNEPRGNFPGPEDEDRNGNGLFDPSNGGISGIVYYATTRAEDDPRFAAAEVWEPGIPRVQVNLYLDSDKDTAIDDLNNDEIVTLADVDNYPFNWTAPAGGQDPEIGPEDNDRNGNGEFDFGDAVNVTWTDSWDDSAPTGCAGEPFLAHGVATDCYDGLRNFNQMRPGVFDGGYAFSSYVAIDDDGDGDDDMVEIQGLPEGVYIVEAAAPPGYEIVKEEDKNVDFGDDYVPRAKMAGPFQPPGLLVPIPVGDDHVVPAELDLFPGVPCRFAGETRPLADRKQVILQQGLNAACDFFLFTKAPIAGHIAGIIVDDLANEFDPNSPTFGEKYSPPWLPVSIRDWTGREISRVYSDEWGAYNALVPSTYTANLGIPSGMSPGMLTVVLNHPGPILDEDPGSPTFGQYITDPYFNRQYSQFAYTFQYMPGTTTYLDTPVVPIAAFAGPDQYPLDCEFPDGTPVIWSVEGPSGGPYVSATGQQIVIASAGMVQVPNPLYDPDGAEPKTITRDYGFGDAEGTVAIGGVALTDVLWTDGAISGTVAGGTETGQLVVTRADGTSTPMGVTVTVGPIAGAVHYVYPSGSPGDTPVQDAIDAVQAGDLILVAPGNYAELVVLWKPVQLQGWGAFSTTINAVKTPAEKLDAWRQKVEDLIVQGAVDLLPGQELGFGGIEPITLFTEEGPGIIVLARNAAPAQGGFGESPNARIDGLSVTGADQGGGILVNGYAHYLQISNNRIYGNQGFYGGGIRIGHPELTVETPGGLQYDHCHNDHVRIDSNQVLGNGGLGGAGGGISLHTGADFYEVTRNYICGNFTVGNGGGIGHLGKSEGGSIAHNSILFNQSFNQGTGVSGGGIYIAGGPALGTLSPGSGSVSVDGNLIQGNLAGAGDGGGIRVEAANGEDVAAAPNTPEDWHTIDIINNFIADNVAGLAGGGISLQDAARVRIHHNTVARNDSTATAGQAFSPGNPNQSNQQPAGIVARAHSGALRDAFGAGPLAQTYSNPSLVNNIVWQNRSFYFFVNDSLDPPFGLLPAPESPDFADLAVLGEAAALNPLNCILTDTSGYDASNLSADPLFVAAYFNGDRGQSVVIPEATTSLQAAPAFDEGGNFIDVRFGPLTPVNPATGEPFGDYHIQGTSPAMNIGDAGILTSSPGLAADYDEEPRPNGEADSGADEYYAAAAQNAAPRASNDAYTLAQDGSLSLGEAPGVLANDSDANGDPLTAVSVDDVDNGILALAPAGTFTYTPTAGFTGTDTFTYRANDGLDDSNVAAVTLNVTAGGNAAPAAVNDGYSVLQEGTLSVASLGVLGNDTDADGDTLMAGLDAGDTVEHGALTFYADGSFTYTPDPGYTGTDTFGYWAYDGSYSTTATVTIEVTAEAVPPNEPPAPTANAITTMVNTDGITRVLPNDPNPYDTHTYAITTPPADGSASMSPTGIVTYSPDTDYTGSDSIVVTVTDQGGASGEVTIDVAVTDSLGTEPPWEPTLQCPPDEDGIDTDGDGIVDNDHVCIHLGAGDGFVTMADGKLQYIFSFSDLTGVPPDMTIMHAMLGAQFPAPTITVKEGQKLYLNLSNVGMAVRPDLFDPHTVHWHGFAQAAPVFDGVPDASISVNMMSTLTYYYNVVDPGTYMYHCHVEATEHMQMGMLGNLYVTPKQDGTPYEYPPGSGRTYTQFAYNDGDGSTGYDVDYPLQLGSFDPDFHDASLNVQPLPFAAMKDKYPMLNGRGYPDTLNPLTLAPPSENGGKESQKVSSLITADQGQRILLRISNLNVTMFNTLACLGIPMQVVGQDARLLRSSSGENLYYTTNSVTLGGGQSLDVILDTTDVAPGTYFLYTTNLNYLSNNEEDFGGMMTHIVIN